MTNKLNLTQHKSTLKDTGNRKCDQEPENSDLIEINFFLILIQTYKAKNRIILTFLETNCYLPNKSMNGIFIDTS